jgi:hypothetical protein
MSCRSPFPEAIGDVDDTLERVYDRAGENRDQFAVAPVVLWLEKTTLELPADLKDAIKREAARQGLSEAEVIRRSIRCSVGADRPRPQGGLVSSGQPIARRVDQLLDGFGER